MKYRRSLLAKLTWLAVGAAFLMALILAAFAVTLFESAGHHHHANYARVVVGVAQRVYQNPLPDRIEQIAKRSGLALRYRDPFVEYASDADMPRFQDVKEHRYLRRGNIVLAKGNGRVVALHRRGGQQLMVDLEPPTNWLDIADDLLVPVAAALLLFWGMTAVLRRMLKPLAILRDDMRAVGEGKWQQTKISRNDEIGELATVFNRMQSRLHDILLAKERFLADASHELRSPLARLRLAAEMVDSPKLRDSMTADIDELERLSGDIMEKTRLDNYASAVRQLPLAVADVIAVLRRKYPQAVFDGEFSATVRGDVDALSRALGNLLDNALKFSDEVRVHCEIAAGRVCIVVEDNGPGVPSADLPHLFEPFYRADTSRSRATGGFGLGLSITHAAIQAHNGEIVAENRTPQGLRVVITLPLDSPADADSQNGGAAV